MDHVVAYGIAFGLHKQSDILRNGNEPDKIQLYDLLGRSSSLGAVDSSAVLNIGDAVGRWVENAATSSQNNPLDVFMSNPQTHPLCNNRHYTSPSLFTHTLFLNKNSSCFQFSDNSVFNRMLDNNNNTHANLFLNFTSSLHNYFKLHVSNKLVKKCIVQLVFKLLKGLS